jgi:sugar lactone lactonase YvrE
MYFIDTPTQCVVAYDYETSSGELSNRKVAILIDKKEGSPDGMAIDQEGMLWSAHWGGYKVSRWNPATGTKLEEVAVPASQVTSCAFGGENLDELYITTARTGLDQDALKEQPFAGGLFKVKTSVKGLPTNKFGV